MKTIGDVVALLRTPVDPPPSDQLSKRVRWLFLALLSLALSTSALGTIAGPSAMPSKWLGILALLAWSAWSVHRYVRPRTPVVTDVVPLAAMCTLGLATGSFVLLFGPAFVSLYYRTMFGSRREAIANALGYFLVYETIWVLTPVGSGPVEALGTGIMLASFLGIAVVMQALGEAARSHEDIVQRERVLTRLSHAFLTASTTDSVHQLAVDGALELTRVDADDSRYSVTLWLGRDELRLAAGAGAVADTHDLVLRAAAPADVNARFMEGAPFLLERAAVTQLQRALGRDGRSQELLATPLVHGAEPMGVLVITSESELPRDLVGLMGRYANEIVLALDRAELLEDLRQANLQLREANAAKDEFVSTVSHELRTPLTSILGFATTLRAHWRELDDDVCESQLDIIERQSRHQQRMIEDLLTTSRAMAKRLPVSPEVIEVGAALDEVVQSLGLDADALTVVGPTDLCLVVDRHHLQQTLGNLLSNAQKYGAGPYEVHVDREVHVDQHDEVVIVVGDHGAGVPVDFRPRLFEPFAQADTGDARTSRGVGLGLSIVKRLMAANGGSIRFVPEGPTPGACFAIRLPAAPCPRRLGGRAHRADAVAARRLGEP